jgi:uncharacterized protein YerC
MRVDVVGVAGGSRLVLMIEAPNSLHTHRRSSLYIYNAIQHLLQRLQVIRMLPHTDIRPQWDVAGGSRLVLMIEDPHSLHTHRRSSLYIYNAIQHLLQRLQVIRMLPHTDIRPQWSGCCWCGRWSLLVLMIEAPNSLHTYLRSSSSSYIYNAIQYLCYCV